jgi:hypothetical protein
MSKKARARRAAKRRRQVDRAERVKPSPLAEAKKRPWSMQVLLEAGREGGGIDADQHEAALEIVDCYRGITAEVRCSHTDLENHRHCPSMKPAGYGDAQRSALYLAWCHEILRRMRLRPAIVVGWIEDTASPIAVELLSRALDLWLQTKHELGRDQRLTPTPRIDNLPTLPASVGADHHSLPFVMSGPAYAPTPTPAPRALVQVTSPTPSRAQGTHRPAPSIVKR